MQQIKDNEKSKDTVKQERPFYLDCGYTTAEWSHKLACDRLCDDLWKFSATECSAAEGDLLC